VHGLLLALWLSACGGDVPKLCMSLAASPNLNTYAEQPHAVMVYVYPLQNRLAFEQAPIPDLLGGSVPAGALGRPLALSVAPGQELDFEEELPEGTRMVGVVADYYRSPGQAEGSRRVVIPPSCGFMSKPSLTLSATDLRAE
jgi:type VI secretion system VasD/TssJ family lipoprotein